MSTFCGLHVLFIGLHQRSIEYSKYTSDVTKHAISELKAGETSENTHCICTILSFPIPAMSQAFEELCSGALSVLRAAEPSASGLQRR